MATSRTTKKTAQTDGPADAAPLTADVAQDADAAAEAVANNDGVNTLGEAVNVANAAAEQAGDHRNVGNGGITQPGGVPTGIPQDVTDAARADALAKAKPAGGKRVEKYKAYDAQGNLRTVAHDLDTGDRTVE